MIAETERPNRRTELSAVKQALLEKRLRGEAIPPVANSSIPRRSNQEFTPLSFPQQRLWFAQRLAADSPLYHISMTLRLEGRLDSSLLTKAFNSLVARHESLRTSFPSLDGEPVQKVDPSAEVTVEQIDLSGEQPGEVPAAVHRAIKRAVSLPFDLSAGKLLRPALLRLRETEHLLVITIHHIVSDGWSMGIIARELMSIYSSLVTRDSVSLPALAIQYADYSCWSQEGMQGDVLGERLNWWKQRIQGAPDFLALPTDHPRPAVQSFRGRCRWKTMRPGLVEELRNLSHEEGGTLFMTLLAAFQIFLHRITGQQDLLVGSPVAGRNHAETEGLIGLFINTLVLRSKLSGDPTFREFLQETRESTIDACAHQDLPFEKLVEELQPERNSSHSPLIQVMFAMQTAMEKTQTPCGLSVEAVSDTEVDTGTAKFDLTLQMEASPHGLSAFAEYNTDLFDEATIDRLLSHFQTLLESVVAHPEEKVSKLELLSPTDRRQLLIDWNRVSTEYPRHSTIPELFALRAAESPEKIAISCGPESVTYGDLDNRANEIARSLRQRGVGRDVLVAVCLERSPDLIVALLGILKAGGAYLSLDPTYPAERLAFMLEDAKAPLVITNQKFKPLFKEDDSSCQVVLIDKKWPPASGNGNVSTLPVRPCESTDLAYVSYTSGSTGTPKGVCIPHRGVIRLLFDTNYIALDETDVLAQMANCGFDASTFEIWGALLHGGRLAIIPQDIVLSPASLARAIKDHGITTMFVTTALFNQLAQETPTIFAGLRHLLFGGEAVNPASVRRVIEKGAPRRLLHVYGPTETTTFATWHETRTVSPDNTVPIGRPISNTEIYVLDQHLQPAPIGVPGELFIGGDGLARGYLNRPELTAEKFIPHPFRPEPEARLYRTGDLVRRWPDSSVEFLGRADTQVKLRGYRIELGEIEAVLGQHPEISACVVSALPDASGEKRLVAHVVLKQPAEATVENLRVFLRSKLPDYMVPSAVVALEALPLNSNGKIDRSALPSLQETGRPSGPGFVPPRDDVERQMAALWEELLAIRPIGAEDNFFDRGGHSLLTVRLLARIEHAFGVNLPVATVFQNPVLAQLTETVRKAKAHHARVSSSIVEIQPNGSLPPLFLVHGVGGGMFWGYTNLSKYLDADQPVYGFKSRGLEGQDEFGTIEEIAAQYVKDLRGFQAHGPYYLGGYCFGGNVAYEMARQLEAQGEKITMLALMNSTPTTEGKPFRPGAAVWILRFAANLWYLVRCFFHRSRGEQRRFIVWHAQSLSRKILRSLGRSARSIQPDELVDLSAYPPEQRRLWEAHIKALLEHRTQPYNGRVTLLRSGGHQFWCSFDPSYGWDGFASEKTEVHIVPGAHEQVLEQPHVRVLGEALRQCLEKVNASWLRSAATSSSAEEAAAQQQVSAQERQQLRDWNSTQAPYPHEKCVHQLFEEQVARTPDATAVVWEGEEISYRELNQRAEQLAARLKKAGVGPDVPVGLCLPRSPGMTVGVLAILKAGGAYVPLDPAYPKERLQLMVENARLPVMVTQEELRNELGLSVPDLKWICLAEKETAAQPTSSSPARNGKARLTVSPENLAYVIHTSGSTGTPKGVAMPHRPLVNLVAWQIQNSRMGCQARTLQFASLSFDVSFQEMFSTWCAGGTLVLVNESLRQDPVALLEFISEQRIERLFLPFVALQQLADALTEDREAPASLREIITAGEQLQVTPKMVRLFERLRDCTLHNHYGPSESHVVTTYTLTGPPTQWPALPPIGRPIANAEIHLLNAQRQPVPIGVAGELYIGGDALARGYLHRPELTAEKFITPAGDESISSGRLYKTGDLARYRPDGNIEFLGRIDDQVKIRGFRIELGEVETALRQHGNISETVVVAREDQPGEKRLVAYHLPKSGTPTPSNELRAFLAEKLPDYMVPAVFVSLKELPLTPTGKVDRKRLPAPAADRPDLDGSFVAPNTESEKNLAGIWRQVLRIDQVGVHDNFFDLGGNSLSAIQVISRVRQTLGVELPLSTFFTAPTVAGQAEKLPQLNSMWDRKEAQLIAREGTGRLPLSFSQQRLWFIDQLAPGNFAYNVPAAVLLQGRVDVEALQHALNEVLQRHAVLRATFAGVNGEPVQTLGSNVHLTIARHDLQKEAATERDAASQRLIVAESQRPFDLQQGPLVRCSLLTLEEHKHVLVIVMHHIVSDGWSIGILLHELAALYEARLMNRLPQLPKPLIQYSDYAIWQRECLQGEVLENHLAYWKRALRGAPGAIELPYDHPGVGESTFQGAWRSVTLPRPLTDAIQSLNRRHDSTSFMVMLAALIVVLSKWTRQTDIVIGTVAAGRERHEIEHLIGCFMNFLPLRIQLNGDRKETALDILTRAKNAILESHPHLDCPFEKVVEAINPERHLHQNPLYNVGFLMQNFPRTIFATPELSGQLLPVQNEAALLDLRFVAEENENGISLTCDYRKDLFEGATIEQLLETFCQVLEEMVARPETRVADFSISEKLSQMAQKARAHAARLLLAITATFTAEPLKESLGFWTKQMDLPAAISFAPYNQVFQQLLDPESLLNRNDAGLNVALLRFADWQRSDQEGGSDDGAEKNVQELILAVKQSASMNTTPLLLVICPSEGSKGDRENAAKYFKQMEETLVAGVAGVNGVSVVTPGELSELYPVSEIYDASGDRLGHVPFTPVFFTALATLIARKLHALKRPPCKVIALDCDNTLWAGVCGEEGPEGVQLNAPQHALQEFMRAQKDAGRLLCLCSKNSEADVAAVFEKRGEMPLRWDHFAANRINWNPKSENLRSLAQELNLGLDSFIFVDDNPMECAEVEANCPEVLTLALPEKTEMIPEFLRHCWSFDHGQVTAEDQQRTRMYQENRQRQELREESLTMTDFLARLELKVQIRNLAAEQVQRVAQLTQRTNQFNVTTLRRTEREVEELRQAQTVEVVTITVSDRFGDYGLVGALMFQGEGTSLAVDTFLLSCRVLGRGVEHHLLAHLGRVASERGLAYVDVHFVPSAKNQPALDFLESVGHSYRQALNGGFVFRFPADVASSIVFQPAEAPPRPTSTERPRTEGGRGAVAMPQLSREFREHAFAARNAGQLLQVVEEKKAGPSNSTSNYVAPKTDLERQLCALWEKLLRVQRVGLDDNFFDLGGHSLLAVRMFADLEKETGKKVPIVTLFQAPTIGQLAVAMTEDSAASQSSSLVPIQAGVSGAPLFLIHGAGGDVLWGYANLARYLSQERPIIGVQAKASERPKDFASLEEMAAHYIGEIRTVQPSGPYYLGGYCFGGNVAYEMARQLEQQGQPVALVALLDSSPSNGSYEKVEWWRPGFMPRFLHNLFYWSNDFLDLKPEERRRFFTRKFRALARKTWLRVRGAYRPAAVDLEEVIDTSQFPAHELALWQSHLRLLVEHVSQPYRGRVTLFRTRGHPVFCSFEKDFGWHKLAVEGVEIKFVPGSHESIFIEPNVKSLATAVEASLAEAGAALGKPNPKSQAA